MMIMLNAYYMITMFSFIECESKRRIQSDQEILNEVLNFCLVNMKQTRANKKLYFKCVSVFLPAAQRHGQLVLKGMVERYLHFV